MCKISSRLLTCSNKRKPLRSSINIRLFVRTIVLGEIQRFAAIWKTKRPCRWGHFHIKAWCWNKCGFFLGSAWPFCQNILTFYGSAIGVFFWLLSKLLWWVAEFAISPFAVAAKVVTPLNWHPCELATFSEQISRLNSVTTLPSPEGGGGRLWHHMHNLLINYIVYSSHDCKTVALWGFPTTILHLQEVTVGFLITISLSVCTIFSV